MVSAMLEKQLCRDGSVCRECLSSREALQFVADRRCNTLPLIVLMDIQPVQIAGLIHVTKANNFAIHHGDNRPVRPKRLVPRLQIYFTGRPRIQLLLRIILRVHVVNGLVKEFCQLCAVGRYVFSKLHVVSSRILSCFIITSHCAKDNPSHRRVRSPTDQLLSDLQALRPYAFLKAHKNEIIAHQQRTFDQHPVCGEEAQHFIFAHIW